MLLIGCIDVINRLVWEAKSRVQGVNTDESIINVDVVQDHIGRLARLGLFVWIFSVWLVCLFV